jgi:hypothetical protein
MREVNINIIKYEGFFPTLSKMLYCTSDSYMVHLTMSKNASLLFFIAARAIATITALTPE